MSTPLSMQHLPTSQLICGHSVAPDDLKSATKKRRFFFIIIKIGRELLEGFSVPMAPPSASHEEKHEQLTP